MDPEEYRRASLETWQSMAAGWERWRTEAETTLTPVRAWLLEGLAPKRGDTMLELAAGAGDTGFDVAELVGETGRLISTDLAPAMVEVARRRAAKLGLENIEHRTMDAERIELEDDSVDGVLCRFGLMLMPDPGAALAETRRVLRPGGRLVLAVWRDGERNPWISLARRMLVARGHVPPPEPGTPGIFSLASDERLRELLERAGFSVEKVEDVPVRFVYDDVDQYIQRARDTGGMFARAFASASEAERSAMTAELTQAFAPFTVDGGLEFPGLALCAAAS